MKMLCMAMLLSMTVGCSTHPAPFDLGHLHHAHASPEQFGRTLTTELENQHFTVESDVKSSRVDIRFHGHGVTGSVETASACYDYYVARIRTHWFGTDYFVLAQNVITNTCHRNIDDAFIGNSNNRMDRTSQ